jgi:hypothetical protein
VDPKEEKHEDMEFQNTKRVLKARYGHFDSEYSDNERHKDSTSCSQSTTSEWRC